MSTYYKIIYLTFLLSACAQKKNHDNNNITDKIQSDTIQVDKKRIEHVVKTYFIGDINNDQREDTAFVIYERSISPDSAIEKKCINPDCEVIIKFSSNIPEIVIPQSLGITIEKTEDLNNDKANEIVLYSEWFEGFWQNISVWTFKNSKWNELAKTRAFLAANKDYENRIIKVKSNYFLVGDGWNDTKGGITKRTIKIEIPK